MKKSGILNAPLSEALAELGHGHLVVIGDCGLPRPKGVRCVDLALVFGVPTFRQVLAAVAAEIEVEGATIASESIERNPAVASQVTELFGEPGTVSHEELKELSRSAELFIRCGEATPYANVVLRCGVPF